MEKVLVSNIQRFSTKDGDGIRTTVFFKGCPLRCKWCHNPETFSPSFEIMYNAENCTLCGRCAANCPNGAITIKNNILTTNKDKCTLCASCTDNCYYNAREISGKEMSVDEIFAVIERDTSFYAESGGGVTFSGGECTLYPDFLTELLKRCKAHRIHTAVDTSGFAPFEVFEKLMPYTDIFLYDIKAYSSDLHKLLTGCPNEIIWENLKKLCNMGAKVNLRLPLVENCNCDLSDIEKIAERTESFGITKVNLLPYHDMGKYKYTKLSKEYDANSMSTPNNEKMEEIKKIFEKHSFNDVKIGG